MSMSENVIPQMTCKVTYQLRENDFANSVTKCKKRLKRETEPSFAMQLTFYVFDVLVSFAMLCGLVEMCQQ